MMAREEVPFKYLIICLADWRCPFDGEFWYWDRIDVAVAMSGLVQWDSHWSDPIICCIFNFNLSRLEELMGSSAMVSIGIPERYGVFGCLALNLSRPTSSARLSMNADCYK